MDKKISPPIFILALSAIIAVCLLLAVYKQGYFFKSGMYAYIGGPIFVVIACVGLWVDRKKSRLP